MITHSAQGPELRLGRSCSPGKIAERRALLDNRRGGCPMPLTLQHRPNSSTVTMR
jgi:hypothetical protein